MQVENEYFQVIDEDKQHTHRVNAAKSTVLSLISVYTDETGGSCGNQLIIKAFCEY
jgi:hypothetical protein